jgi:site-specific DNA-methyltransferase (cytosine-N4-specific)
MVEMRMIFQWLNNQLKSKKYACFVVGNSTIKGERINNAQLLSELASETGFTEVARISRKLQSTRKAFNPSIGKIKTENIIIFQKVK